MFLDLSNSSKNSYWILTSSLWIFARMLYTVEYDWMYSFVVNWTTHSEYCLTDSTSSLWGCWKNSRVIMQYIVQGRLRHSVCHWIFSLKREFGRGIEPVTLIAVIINKLIWKDNAFCPQVAAQQNAAEPFQTVLWLWRRRRSLEGTHAHRHTSWYIHCWWSLESVWSLLCSTRLHLFLIKNTIKP